MTSYYADGYTPPDGVTSTDAVKKMQEQLNGAGASVDVDGVWGEQTQNAYNTYGASLQSTDTAATDTATTPTFANEKLNTYYNQILSGLTANTIDYTPKTEDELAAEISAYLRPSTDSAIADRREQTAANRASIDVDAASRGILPSTWVTDMKNRQFISENADVADLESQYTSALNQGVSDRLANQESNALSVAQFNARMKSEAESNAYARALDMYNLNGGSGGGSKTSGDDTTGGMWTEEERAYFTLLAKTKARDDAAKAKAEKEAEEAKAKAEEESARRIARATSSNSGNVSGGANGNRKVRVTK